MKKGLAMLHENPEEYELILNYKEIFKKYIENMQKESIKTLKSWDYPDQQIDAIKNFDCSDEAFSRASAFRNQLKT